MAQLRYHFGGDLDLNTAIFFKGFLAIGRTMVVSAVLAPELQDRVSELAHSC